MSSKPSSPGVAQVVELLAEIDALEIEQSDLVPKIKRLRDVQQLLHEKCQQLPKLLDGMDVARNGNAGWEGRVGWFLGEMRRQVAAKAKKEGDNE